ncbi:MAG: NADH-quinone oxidoreductase subunit J [Rhodospirillaceae bacterium]|jgi:NADH-quinone oxidoreductase subunit J|nr:NADH-quinone oxidoreductase subunit J [Rhodospirillaceae bacterium]MBT6509399.1 NADH-quinone oxidoreductase subunit J [Rhodospirillaceae bacterium]MBT7611669.1 NADH-quinone oxidoreductase subunit J [Rhodospirillaceae bacterium]MBT7647433.1 NADH-quinone oxidoreductase subunit J [Rhodospirillaceae bacterium]
MILQTATFYLFATVLLASAVMVISARNPVHSVLYLILAFFNAAALFVLIGAEFLAMILVVVYVGAVAVLFLFVVMMLDINLTEIRQGFLQYLPIGALIGLILMVELVLVGGAWQMQPELTGIGQSPIPALADRSNTAAIGDVLYTQFAFLFQGAGIILLIAMIGAIVLTLRHRDIKRQRISDQITRRPEDVVEVRKVRSGEGV